MIDELPHCESRYEAISLLAAGYLSSIEEHDLRLHLAKCSGCLKRLEQSTAVCLGLITPPLCGSDFRLLLLHAP